MKRILVGAIVAFALSAQAPDALAQERRPLPDALFGGIVQDRDVTVFFDYLREALNAAMEGREAAPPDELAHALMGVPLHTRERYEQLFVDAGLRVRRTVPFGAPHTYLFVLEAS